MKLTLYILELILLVQGVRQFCNYR